jgi:CTP synthase (UTP-ammonia lyase)
MRIGIVGDYNPEFESHRATVPSILLAAKAAGIDVTAEWLPTTQVCEQMLSAYDGLWAASGSPYGSMNGMLAAIRFARERLRPMVAT